MADKYKDELWKKVDVPDLDPDEDVWVSNFGRIRSFKTSKVGGKIIGGSWLTGYNILVLKLTENRRRTVFVHKLVAEYFVENKPKGADHVVHIDYNKNNNHFSNLQFVSREDLRQHRRKDKDYDVKKVRNSKLTIEDVKRLKRRIKANDTKPYRLAQEFGITHTQLNRIKNNENWQHVTID